MLKFVSIGQIRWRAVTGRGGFCRLDHLIGTIGDALTPFGFNPRWHDPMESLGVVAFWRGCSLNRNRAVVMVRRPVGNFELRAYCQRLKGNVLRHTPFVGFLYQVGLQFIVVGDGLEQTIDIPVGLRGIVDRFSSQSVILQSVFVVDTSTNRYAAARTWGQRISGQFHNAIADGIEAAGIKSITFD